MALDIVKLRALQSPDDLGFKIRRLGHVVLQVSDLERSLLFYTQVLGFEVTEIHSEDLQPGGFAFLRCHTDHHSIALVGTGAGRSRHAELHHIAFEVESLDEVFRVRERLREQGATITFEGRHRAGCQSRWSFSILMATASKSTGGWSRSAPAALSGLQSNGRGSGR